MRRVLESLVVAAAAATTLNGLATAATAVCGGGAPGEACYCPSEIDLIVKQISTPISCSS